MNTIKKTIEMIADMHKGITYLDNSVDEVIAELEELQSRSCDGCKYQTIAEADCKTCSRYYRDGYEPKER